MCVCVCVCVQHVHESRQAAGGASVDAEGMKMGSADKEQRSSSSSSSSSVDHKETPSRHPLVSTPACSSRSDKSTSHLYAQDRITRALFVIIQAAGEPLKQTACRLQSANIHYVVVRNFYAKYCGQRVCVLAVLFVYSLAYLKNHTSKFLCACYVWQRLGPALMAVR